MIDLELKDGNLRGEKEEGVGAESRAGEGRVGGDVIRNGWWPWDSSSDAKYPLVCTGCFMRINPPENNMKRMSLGFLFYR